MTPERDRPIFESNHFKDALSQMPRLLAGVPEIIHVEVPGYGWSRVATVP